MRASFAVVPSSWDTSRHVAPPWRASFTAAASSRCERSRAACLASIRSRQPSMSQPPLFLFYLHKEIRFPLVLFFARSLPLLVHFLFGVLVVGGVMRWMSASWLCCSVSARARAAAKSLA